MARELFDRLRLFQNKNAIPKQILLLLQTEIWIMYTHFEKTTSIQQTSENHAIN